MTFVEISYRILYLGDRLQQTSPLSGVSGSVQVQKSHRNRADGNVKILESLHRSRWFMSFSLATLNFHVPFFLAARHRILAQVSVSIYFAWEAHESKVDVPMKLNGAMTFITSNLKDLQGILPQVPQILWSLCFWFWLVWVGLGLVRLVCFVWAWFGLAGFAVNGDMDEPAEQVVKNLKTAKLLGSCWAPGGFEGAS